MVDGADRARAAPQSARSRRRSASESAELETRAGADRDRSTLSVIPASPSRAASIFMSWSGVSGASRPKVKIAGRRLVWSPRTLQKPGLAPAPSRRDPSCASNVFKGDIHVPRPHSAPRKDPPRGPGPASARRLRAPPGQRRRDGSLASRCCRRPASDARCEGCALHARRTPRGGRAVGRRPGLRARRAAGPREQRRGQARDRDHRRTRRDLLAIHGRVVGKGDRNGHRAHRGGRRCPPEQHASRGPGG